MFLWPQVALLPIYCLEGEQSSQHILGECGALNQIRFKYFNQYQIPHVDFYTLKKSAIVGFLREAPVDELQFFIEAEQT